LGGGAHLLRVTVGEPDVEDEVATVLHSGFHEPDLEPEDGGVIGPRRVVQDAHPLGRVSALRRGQAWPARGQGDHDRPDGHRGPPLTISPHRYLWTRGQPPWLSGRKASAAGMVARTL